MMSRGKIACLTYEIFRLGTIRKIKSRESSGSRYRVVRKLRKNKLNKCSVRVLTIGKYIPLIYTFRNADFTCMIQSSYTIDDSCCIPLFATSYQHI